MEQLQTELHNLLDQLQNGDEIRARLETLLSVYPFNEYEYVISTLLGAGVLSLDDYYLLRDEYIGRNLYLYIFEISAPRTFGELWAQGHLKGLVPELIKPNRKIDPDYSGQYDFLLDSQIRIEVKASRAVDFDSDAPLYAKALATNSLQRFDMNFQQIKPACCDVFVWIGVWRDVIRYWVLASDEVANNRYYSIGQHRGNIGEGQLHLKQDNIAAFAGYEVRPNELKAAVYAAYQRQKETASR